MRCSRGSRTTSAARPRGRHLHRDLDRLERLDRARDGDRDVLPRLADALRAGPAAALRLDDETRRRSATEGGEGAAGVDGRHLEPGADRSPSGILLGKTMGRTELARRFETEVGRLAELEVRSRMTGRWMMASIQTSFAVMPALVYLFAGHFAGSVSLGTVIAFTTLQARLFFPIGSLLGVGLEVQTSLALFDRVFEYLDQPVDIEDARSSRPAAMSPSTGSPSATRTASWTLSDVSFDVPRGSKTALVGETGPARRLRGYLVARLYDVTRGTVTIDGHDVRELTFPSLANAVGVVSQETYLFHASVRDNLRFARPDATDEEVEEAAPGAQIHEPDHRPPGRLRDRRRRARLSLLGRRAAADRDRADDPAQPADPRPRRSDVRSTRRRSAPSRTRSSAWPKAGRRSRSPTGSLSATPTRSSSRPRSRRRDRHARGAAGRGRPLRRARLPRYRRGAHLSESANSSCGRPCTVLPPRPVIVSAASSVQIDSSTASITAS